MLFHRIVLVSLVTILGMNTFVGSAGGTPVDDLLGCTPHPTIRIEQDEGPLGFILGRDPVTGEPIPRPGSGVTDGDGTPEDPFMIEGWCIRSNVQALPLLSAIFIANTDAHVVIQDNIIGEAWSGSYGLYLWGVRNVHVTGNVIEWQDWAGIRLRESAGNEVANNTIRSSSLYGMMVDWGSHDNVIKDNTVTNTVMYGIYLLNGAYNNDVVHNDFSANHIAVRFFNAHGNLIADNVMTGNEWGVFNSVVSSHNVVTGNDISGNDVHGVENNVNNDLDARGNWWGCPDGPGEPGCDSATGRVLTGSWLTAPPPAAGRR